MASRLVPSLLSNPSSRVNVMKNTAAKGFNLWQSCVQDDCLRKYSTTLSTENYSEATTTQEVGSDGDLKERPATFSVSVVPGKGLPPEPPVECCMSGCANCVWIAYAEELKEYYSDGGKAALKAIESIENPSLRAFVKLELSLK